MQCHGIPGTDPAIAAIWNRAHPASCSGSPCSRPHPAPNTSERSSLTPRPLIIAVLVRMTTIRKCLFRLYSKGVWATSGLLASPWEPPLPSCSSPLLSISSCIKVPQSIWKEGCHLGSDGEVGKYRWRSIHRAIHVIGNVALKYSNGC